MVQAQELNQELHHKVCGRFALIGDPFELGFKDNFNIAPSTDIPVKTLDCDGQFMKWSFSPLWKNDMN